MEFGSCDMHISRMLIAVCWCILFQFMLLSTYITIMNVNVWNFSGLASIPVHCLSIKSLYILPLAAIVFFLGGVWSRDYVKPVNAQFINRRLLLLLNLFSYHNLSALCMYLVLGIAIPYIYTSLSNGTVQSISVKCTNTEHYFAGEFCLNERKFFLILGGIWIAVYAFFKEHLNTKSLIFPPIQQPKFRRLKAIFKICIKRCIVNAVCPSLLFFICYYLKGNLPRSYFRLFVRLELSDHLLDSFYELLDKELIIYLWLFSTIFLLTLDVMTISFNIHLTERAYFPVSSFSVNTHGLDCNFLLQDALSLDTIPIIQHLGFLDLALLSQFQYERRNELFMLSEPGGHPHTWRAIVSECYKVISKFTVELNKCIEDLQPKPAKKPEKPAENVFSTSSYHQTSRIRNLSAGPNVECVDQSPLFILQKSCERAVSVYQEWFRSKLETFSKKPVIAYLFGEINEPKMKHLLLQSQPVIWAVESLSHLICHSLKEDLYGTAQQDLAKVIIMLLQLKNSLDKLNKQCIFIAKSNKLDLVDTQLKNALKCSVKQSIYRIAITFGPYIDQLHFEPPELATQMRHFVQFKEV